MSSVSQYILKVTSTALLISIVTCIIDNKSPIMPYIKLVSGLFLTVTVFSPILGATVGSISEYITMINTDADSIIVQSQQDQHLQKVELIKERTEAYILEKAETLGLEVSVEIDFANADSIIPSEAHIFGAVSPYAKKQLTAVIANDLGIPEEHQIWHQI